MNAHPLISKIAYGLLLLVFAEAAAFSSGYLVVTTVAKMDSTYSHLRSYEERFQNELTVAYLTGPLFAPNPLSFFSKEEQNHMTEVKRFVDVAFLISVGCWVVMFLIMGALSLKWVAGGVEPFLFKTVKLGFWLLLTFALILSLLIWFDFGRLWHQFHVLFFPNGGYTFPYGSKIIQLYPPAFFITFLVRCNFGMMILALAVLLSVRMSSSLRKTRRFPRLKEVRVS